MKTSSRSTILTILFLITGCASTSPHYPNVSLNEEHQIESVRISLEGSSDQADLADCVTSSLTMEEVELSDSSGAKWVPFTIFVLLIPDHRKTVEGGEIVLSQSKNTLVAVGRERYSWMGLQQFLDFELKTETGVEQNVYTFTNLFNAQEKTGDISNPGFTPVHCPPETCNFGTVYAVLEDVTSRINSCLLVLS